MKFIAFFLFVFFIIILQGTIFNGLRVYGIKPDFLFILSYGIGLYKGEMKGLLLGGFIGLLMDCSTGIILGPNLASKATIGFLSGNLRRKVFRVTAGLNLAFLFILSILDGVMNYLSINIFLGPLSFLNSFQFVILPQAVYNSLIGIIILILLERFRLKYVRTG